MGREKRRQYGTGSVYRRASDGRWVGVLQAGWTARGTRRTVTVSASCRCGDGPCKGEARCLGAREARRKLDRKRAELAGDAGATGDARATVRSWSATWLEALAHRARPKYLATEASAVRAWIVPTIGHRHLADLTPGDVRTVTNAVRKAGRSTTTAGYVQGVLERMLRAAMVEGHPVPPRVLMLDAPGKATNDRDAIPADDARALLDAATADGEHAARWAAAFLQGMRQGECLGLTWDAVDLAGGTIDVSWQLQALPYVERSRPAAGFKIPDGYEVRHLHDAWHLVRPKSARGQRVIPLVPWMTAALTVWRELAPDSPWGLVWPRPDGRAQSSEKDRAAWHALQSAAGVAHPTGRPYYLHEARHTTATLLLEAGVDPAVVTAILGHSSILTSRGYQHVSQSLARKALDDVAARLQLEA